MIPAPLRTQVRDAVDRAWATATDSGALPDIPADDTRPTVEVEHPAKPEHGDLASNLALKLARPARKSPLEIATLLAAKLVRDGSDDASPVEAVEVAPPGFLNVRVKPAAFEAIVDGILAEPDAWGRVAPISTRAVNVEFVSANPTGPLTIGNARGAFIGDLLSRVLEAGGQRVTREYYFNDAGGQIDQLGASVCAIRRGEPVPDDGYRGDYVNDLAAAVPDDVWTAATAEGADAAAIVGRWAAAEVREGIEASLERLGVHFDVWTTEATLHDDGWVDRAVERLRERGHLYEEDGATWFRSTAFGDDKDRVVYRSNGQPTYFAADIGYVTEKFSRGFDHLIYIWGADHHGTVARVRNAAGAMGYDVEAVQVLLYSWVRFVRDGVEVSMSKRAGEFITLDELLAEVGVDAARWSFASRAATSSIDFDIELAKTAVEREPRLLRAVRPRPHRVDPAQGGRRRSGPGRERGGHAGRWPGGRPGTSDRAAARGDRGRRRRRGDPGHHRVRDGAGDGVPRVLPRCPGGRRQGAGAIGVAARPRPGDADHARPDARAARDLRAGVDVVGRPR